MASSLPLQRLTDDALWPRVARQARCADSGLDPDQWYPVSTSPAPARHEAAAAITICASCPVRAQRLELSLRHWDTVQHGVWSGPVATDRARPRRPSRAAAMTRCPRAGWTRPAPWRTWPGFWPPPMKDGGPVFYRFAVPGEL
jgi:hypothetical protein